MGGSLSAQTDTLTRCSAKTFRKLKTTQGALTMQQADIPPLRCVCVCVDSWLTGVLLFFSLAEKSMGTLLGKD